jgi:hypothetical protein
VCIDVHEALKQSGLLQANYMLSYQVKQVTMCACSVVRGVFTSDNLYDFANLPADMRFKFSFHMSKWGDYFSWIDLPADAGREATQLKQERSTKTITFADEQKDAPLTDKQRDKMDKDISEMLDARRQVHREKTSKVESRPISNKASLHNLKDGLAQMDEEQYYGYKPPSDLPSVQVSNRGEAQNQTAV